MRRVLAFQAVQTGNTLSLSRCGGEVENFQTKSWRDAVEWLVAVPLDDTFTVVFSLYDFTKALFSLLPEEQRALIGQQDRIVHEGVKVFYAPGRYLGLTVTVPVNPDSNLYETREINLQAIAPWVTDEEEVTDIRQLWELSTNIVKVLASWEFYPTKLTSPVAVFADCYLGDPRNYPTIFNFDEDCWEAQEYATEMMRYEWRSAYQIGMFPETHLYDLISAYPSIIAGLPDTTHCQCEKSYSVPAWAQWGIVKGKVTVTSDISPLVMDYEDGRINPKGTWRGIFTTKEIGWLHARGAGYFNMEDGWFFRFNTDRPYRLAVQWLFARKQGEDKLAATIAKRMSQGISGKLDEDRQDDTKGDWYNPILAAMVRSQCRLKVADFIHANNLQPDLVAILVDSVLATRKVDIQETGALGTWRYEGQSPAIVLGKGGIWRPGKRPQGIGYDDLLEAFKASPDIGYYEFKSPSGGTRVVDMLLDDSDRVFDHYPKCGKDVLKQIAKSTAIEVDAE